MKNYYVDTEFIFKGTFIVKADSKKEAREFIEKHCGVVLGGDIHSTLPIENIDWIFNVHPETKVKKVLIK